MPAPLSNVAKDQMSPVHLLVKRCLVKFNTHMLKSIFQANLFAVTNMINSKY